MLAPDFNLRADCRFLLEMTIQKQQASGETRTRKKALQELHVAHYITLANMGMVGLEPTTHRLKAECSSH